MFPWWDPNDIFFIRLWSHDLYHCLFYSHITYCSFSYGYYCMKDQSGNTEVLTPFIFPENEMPAPVKTTFALSASAMGVPMNEFLKLTRIQSLSIMAILLLKNRILPLVRINGEVNMKWQSNLSWQSIVTVETPPFVHLPWYWYQRQFSFPWWRKRIIRRLPGYWHRGYKIKDSINNSSPKSIDGEEWILCAFLLIEDEENLDVYERFYRIDTSRQAWCPSWLVCRLTRRRHYAPGDAFARSEGGINTFGLTFGEAK